ncbi:MAG: HEAT repeat domain-containing protein [Desulfobacteraceae bacterium]|nr:MAG: HEAT repeat domain-containing protein [Desulfobacteraceae bacterium]
MNLFMFIKPDRMSLLWRENEIKGNGMETGEEIKAAKGILQILLKARKNLRLYPANNPVYAKTLEESFEKFTRFFQFQDQLIFRIRLYDIYYMDELVYHNTDQKNENLSFFLFKDGLRELTFQKKMPVEELTSFIKIISMDFEQDVLDDDVVTLFWEADFSYIRYVVEDEVLADEDYEAQAVAGVKARQTEPGSFQAAYDDATAVEIKIQNPAIVSLTESDLKMLFIELEDDAKDKIDKFMTIIFEIFYKAKTAKEVEDVVGFFNSAIEYAVRQGNIQAVMNTLERLAQIAQSSRVNEIVKHHIKSVFHFTGSQQILDLVGQHFDSGLKPDPKPFQELIRFLDKDSIPHLMDLLGNLDSIYARKVIIDALVYLCPKSLLTITKGLSSPKWYVVRNIIYILRENKDSRAVEYLLKTVSHPDLRVRKEVIRALGELGDSRVLPALQSFLDDPDMQTRLAAVRALGSLSSGQAKAMVLVKISEKAFNDKSFNEKKEFFHVLAIWKDKEVVDFLIKTLMKTALFGSAKVYESKACAAYSLGMIGDRSALPYLFKCRGAHNKLLQKFSETAIQRIEDENRIQS